MGNNTMKKPEEIRIYNMVDMGLRFSGMIRLFEKGSKSKMMAKVLMLLPELFNARSYNDFKEAHSKLCTWATKMIYLAEKQKNGKIIKKRSTISYGQAGKSIDVTLKVLVYYCN
jgi:hypothetical protein